MVNNFSWLFPNEIAGSAFLHTEEDVEELFNNNIRAIVSLTANLPPPMNKIAELEIEHLHLPIIDLGVPNDTQIYTFLRFVEHNLPNKPVVVHCYAGIGRTGTMLALYLVWNELMNGEEAIAYVRRIRPYSIETVEQEDLIIQFAQNLSHHKKRYAEIYGE
ncbi:MAG: phosphatase domain-containing protein [Candidatus Heimdallarchaeaceae archaeon]